MQMSYGSHDYVPDSVLGHPLETETNRYRRYHIETRPTPNIVPWPSRFKVKVGRVGLARLLVRELIQYRGEMEVVLSRPCLYGVFSGPLGGFWPREEKCVGCLRCTTQYPEFVEIRPNPAREELGDSYFTFLHVDSITYEASTGSIPVKGAGYRGKFGGQGWDGMWTDMSEIVRPTRDGIHGREFISSVVDIGRKPAFLVFDGNGHPAGEIPDSFKLPIPFLFDAPPPAAAHAKVNQVLANTGAELGSLAILPLETVLDQGLVGPHVVPLVGPDGATRLKELTFRPLMVEMDGWEEALFRALQKHLPEAMICLRTPFVSGEPLLAFAEKGIDVLHLTADYHGRGTDGTFVLDLIQAAHRTFVGAGRRDEITLLGSGGVVAAEHLPKAIIAGLDAVVLDTPLLVALQAKFSGEFSHRQATNIQLPDNLTVEWGVQRLMNLAGTWRDQLLEIMGAMGLREVRRLRGEMGRAMLQKDLEREAFSGIDGYFPLEVAKG